MRRQDFIKKLGLGSLVLPLGSAISKTQPKDNSADSADCVTTPSETAGPFPTRDPASLAIQDIRFDRKGIEMTVQLAVQNKNNGCAPLAGVIVDVWHCDKDGYYSEYGGSGMQERDFKHAHFLRGRQTTNAQGIVNFKTIYPGWYAGRAPHIHVEILDAAEKSLLITQIAFPTDISNEVYTKAASHYVSGTQDTTNSSDRIFRDSIATQMPVITGSLTSGFNLTHKIIVEA
jgi:protocatechuate 3,4-dioxygenase beta subunit